MGRYGKPTSTPQSGVIPYTATPTGRKFHASWAFVRGILGPYGSGKSSMCCMEVLGRAMEQNPFEGVRRSRWAFIRSTYNELITTTMKTWKEWVPESVCPITMGTPISAFGRFPLKDGTMVELEVIFLSLDREEDTKKLKSLELTGGWINEAKDLPEIALNDLKSRVRRFPSKRLGGYAWSGVIMDTNPPDEDSWWYRVFEEEKPRGYELFKQPPAILEIPRKSDSEPRQYVPNTGQGAYPSAENVENHNEGFNYWMDLVPGASEAWIKVYLMGQYGSIYSGRPVYHEYDDDLHCAKEELQPYRGMPYILGFDYGLCYSDDTEVLTRDGWKFFKDVDEKRDTAATLNPATKAVSFTKINFKIARDYSGEMLQFSTHNMDFLVTPEHRVPYTCRDTPNVFRFSSAEDLESRQTSHRYIQLAGHWDGPGYSLLGLPEDLSMRVWGWYLAEGCCYSKGSHAKVSIYQKTRAEELEKVLFDPAWRGIGIEWRKSGIVYSATSRRLCRLFGTTGLSGSKYIPDDVKMATRDGARAFLDAFVSGDGYRRSRTKINSGIGRKQTGEWCCATISTRLKDDLQEMMMKAGWGSSARVQHGKGSTMRDGRKIPPCDIWIITAKRLKRAEITPGSASRVSYSGKIYCLNVPFHTLYVRRNGKPCWNGNTPACVIAQVSPKGQLRVLDELVSGAPLSMRRNLDPDRYVPDMGIRQFATSVVKPYITTRYENMVFTSIGDPRGDVRAQSDETTCIEELERAGIPTEMARTNIFIARREAVSGYLTRLIGPREAAFLLSPRCHVLRKGFQGAYKYREVKDTREKREPEKNIFSHVQDGLQYIAMYAAGDNFLNRSGDGGGALYAGSDRALPIKDAPFGAWD